jgi:hypothetical protein
VAGATASGERLPDWRQFDLTKITSIEPLGGTFAPAPGLDRRADKYATGLIACV